MAASTRIFLITGANSGVEYAATQMITSASPDYHVVMAFRSLPKAQDAMNQIESSGIVGSISLLEMNVADEESIIAGAKKVEEQFGRLDVLVNNAGIAVRHGDFSQKALQNLFNVNDVGPILVVRYFEPLLEKSKSPYVIQISSGLGSIQMTIDNVFGDSSHEWSAYAASKAALNMMMVQAHRRLSEKGFKTFGLCPGLVRSNLRGTSEEQISSSGNAGDPIESGHLILAVAEGERDKDVGKVVHKGGVYPW